MIPPGGIEHKESLEDDNLQEKGQTNDYLNENPNDRDDNLADAEVFFGFLFLLSQRTCLSRHVSKKESSHLAISDKQQD